MKKLKIAFVGLKGIPAKWGGIEVYVQEIAKRLVERGHHVTVYSRKWFVGSNINTYEGVNIVTTPTIKTKGTDALMHGLTASLHAAASNYDIVHYHGLASFFFTAFPKMFRKKVVITFHANSWVEPKWNNLAVKTLKTATNLGIRSVHKVTTISPVLQAFLATISKKKVILTPPGVDVGKYRDPISISKEYGLSKNNYLLFMGRLDTVKRVDLLIEAFKSLPETEMKLVITGDSGPSDSVEYKKKLLESAMYDNRIIFTGFQSGIVKEELLSNCFMLVLPSINEGVPIALLEGMSYGRPCLASDIPAHGDIISDGINGFLTNADSFQDFKQKLAMIIALDDTTLKSIGANALKLVRRSYNWEDTVTLLEETYYQLIC